MSALADELLADLDGLSEGEDDVKDEEQPESGPRNRGLKRKAPGSDEEMSEEGEEESEKP